MQIQSMSDSNGRDPSPHGADGESNDGSSPLSDVSSEADETYGQNVEVAHSSPGYATETLPEEELAASTAPGPSTHVITTTKFDLGAESDGSTLTEPSSDEGTDGEQEDEGKGDDESEVEAVAEGSAKGETKDESLPPPDASASPPRDVSSTHPSPRENVLAPEASPDRVRAPSHSPQPTPPPERSPSPHLNGTHPEQAPQSAEPPSRSSEGSSSRTSRTPENDRMVVDHEDQEAAVSDDDTVAETSGALSAEELAAQRRAQALDELAFLEVRFANLRDRLYLERMAQAEREMVSLKMKTHPELSSIMYIVDQLHNQYLRQSQARFDALVRSIELEADSDTRRTWKTSLDRESMGPAAGLKRYYDEYMGEPQPEATVLQSHYTGRTYVGLQSEHELYMNHQHLFPPHPQNSLSQVPLQNLYRVGEKQQAEERLTVDEAVRASKRKNHITTSAFGCAPLSKFERESDLHLMGSYALTENTDEPESKRPRR